MRRDALNRRQMLGTLARWTVPTVATIALSARPLQAKASCPPCQKKQGAQCKPCAVNQILQCNCEPCLGPPYCAAVGPSARPNPSNISGYGTTSPGASYSTGAAQRSQALRELQRQRLRQQPADPFQRPLYRDPFGVERRDPRAPTAPPSLYERLQQTPQGRRP